MLRAGRLIWLCLCLGCHSPAGVDIDPPGPPEAERLPQKGSETSPGPTASEVESRFEAASQLWEQGQAAMRRQQPEQAVRLYEQSLAVDPSLTRNYLSLAAAQVECGRETAACISLGKYLTHHPESIAGRAYYADLLFKLERIAEARTQFLQFIADAQDSSERHGKLIHAHSRVMEIAVAQDDAYEEHLNRGIGLFLLAQRRTGLGGDDGDLPADGLLWKAACELRAAHKLRPAEARPCWYLYSTWRALGQAQPARKWLRETLDKAPFAHLTPAEGRSLHLAVQCLENRL